MQNDEPNIVKRVCKELGLSEADIGKSETLKRIIAEHEEMKTFEKVLRRVLGVDRLENRLKEANRGAVWQ